MEEMTPGIPTAFFSYPGKRDVSLALVSTEETPSNLTLALYTNDGTAGFAFEGLDIRNRNLFTVATSLSQQYESLYVDAIYSTSTTQLVHSTGAITVFRFGRDFGTMSKDASCDQILPVSMTGSEYVTFPSLPLDSDVTDHFTVVAAYRDTTITVYDPDSGAVLRTITLEWPGDLYDLDIPASGFYSVRGSQLFYLYARLVREGGAEGYRGFCSLGLLHEGLFRDTYQLVIAGPLVNMTAVYVVTVVETVYKETFRIVGGGDGRVQTPDLCQRVQGTKWSGCYFHLSTFQSGEMFVVESTLSNSSLFGAYVFTTRGTPKNRNTACFPLGLLQTESDLDYDITRTLNLLKSKPQCEEDPTTTTPTPSMITTQPPSPPAPTTATIGVDDATTTTTNLPDTTTDANISTTGPPNCNGVQTTDITYTAAELDKILSDLIAHLTVEKESLSSVRRAKISAPDTRSSSTTMGLFSISLISVTLGLVILLDLSKLVSDVKSAVAGMRS